MSLLLFLNKKRSFYFIDKFSFFSVIFHVATLMPTRDSDPGCNSKKMHIGNDFVTIVYNDSQQAVKFGRIKVRFSLLRRRTFKLVTQSFLLRVWCKCVTDIRLRRRIGKWRVNCSQARRADQINCQFIVILASRKT